METVDSKEQIAANVLVYDSYRKSRRSDEQEFYAQRLRLGKIFVCLPRDGRVIFCPSRFAGYKNNTMAKHLAFEGKSGSVTTPRISSVLGISHEANEMAEREYLWLCEALKVEPSAKKRTYWRMNSVKSASPHPRLGGEPGFPDEVGNAKEYVEGAVNQVFVNAYERNTEARKACIKHYGVNCAVCGFNFESVYGVIGQGFVHVHHVTPLATRGAQYRVDPITDLRPVCPNCHAMLHASDPPFSIEEVQELVNSTQQTSRPNKTIHRTSPKAARR